MGSQALGPLESLGAKIAGVLSLDANAMHLSKVLGPLKGLRTKVTGVLDLTSSCAMDLTEVAPLCRPQSKTPACGHEGPRPA